ncbi:MAG: hypothetical protein IPH57_16450 [Saprospiraceae bacterium]|nr:hypothetical protein [Saprospiraceae bacterium]
MKTSMFIFVIVTVTYFTFFASSQGNVGINNDNSAPDASAMLDVKSTTKGILIPRMTTTERIAVVSPATGLLVYDVTTGSFWYYTSSAWINLSKPPIMLADADNDTKIQVEKVTDEDIIRFDLAGSERMTLIQNATGQPRLEIGTGTNLAVGSNALLVTDPTLTIGNTAIGNMALSANTAGNYNTGIGYQSLSSNTTGGSNTAMGYGALTHNNAGNHNTANGQYALFSNTTGYSNTANGMNSLYSNTTGNDNTANGLQSLYSNTAGVRNTANGVNALYSNTTGDYNTANGSYVLFPTPRDIPTLPMAIKPFIPTPQDLTILPME